MRHVPSAFESDQVYLNGMDINTLKAGATIAGIGLQIRMEDDFKEEVATPYTPSRLDYFAGMALQGILAAPGTDNIDLIVKDSLKIAECMIAAIDAEAQR